MSIVSQFYGGHLLHFSFPLEGSKAFTNLSYASCNSQCCLSSFQFFSSGICLKMMLCARLASSVSIFLFKKQIHILVYYLSNERALLNLFLGLHWIISSKIKKLFGAHFSYFFSTLNSKTDGVVWWKDEGMGYYWECRQKTWFLLLVLSVFVSMSCRKLFPFSRM